MFGSLVNDPSTSVSVQGAPSVVSVLVGSPLLLRVAPLGCESRTSELEFLFA